MENENGTDETKTSNVKVVKRRFTVNFTKPNGTKQAIHYTDDSLADGIAHLVHGKNIVTGIWTR